MIDWDILRSAMFKLSIQEANAVAAVYVQRPGTWDSKCFSLLWGLGKTNILARVVRMGDLILPVTLV